MRRHEMASKGTGWRGTTIWIPESAWQWLLQMTLGVLDVSMNPDRDRVARARLVDLLEEYLEEVEPAPPGERPCHVGTLLHYPGRVPGLKERGDDGVFREVL